MIIRKTPGRAPEVLKDRLAASAVGDAKKMPDQREVDRLGVVIYYDGGKATSAPPTICDGRLYWGQIYIAGPRDAKGKPTDLKDPDKVLWDLLAACRYTRIDDKHNIWRCRHCGFITRLEADGPYENGWNVCPHCSLTIQHPREGKKK